MKNKSIIVLGAGPAGVVAAIGLRRLGFDVSVVSDWRRFPAVEGVSPRVFDSLRRAGLRNACACTGSASSRLVNWSGMESVRNQEFLIDRTLFDQGLREDLREAGVPILAARVRDVREDESGHHILLEGGEELQADFLIEARGRQAPQAGGRLRGPETVTLTNQWKEAPGRDGSAVESLPEGWAWMARLSNGHCFWQLSLDTAAQTMPARADIPRYCASKRGQSILANQLFSEAANPAGVSWHARSSTAILALETGGNNWLRVGDAAMAVDPLSGNGIFQSLSSALAAPAVIKTLLIHPERSAFALDFHRRRIQQLFLRFARTGRDFYALEEKWSNEVFWRERGVWPDARELYVSGKFADLKIESAPVLKNDLIEMVEVVTSIDQPLGMWHIGGVELAPRVRRLQTGETFEAVTRDLDEVQRAGLSAWLVSQGYAVA